MPPDSIRAGDARAWLGRALLDLRSAEVDLAASPPITGDAMFHSQQAVDKALKALLTWHDRPFRKTHDLVELGGLCVELVPALESVLRLAAPLTEFAWRFRYPGELMEPPGAEADAAVALAWRAVLEVMGHLPAEVRPTPTLPGA